LEIVIAFLAPGYALPREFSVAINSELVKDSAGKYYAILSSFNPNSAHYGNLYSAGKGGTIDTYDPTMIISSENGVDWTMVAQGVVGQFGLDIGYKSADGMITKAPSAILQCVNDILFVLLIKDPSDASAQYTFPNNVVNYVYSLDKGVTWNLGTFNVSQQQIWKRIAYMNGVYVAIADLTPFYTRRFKTWSVFCI
jgi:hypothetical protein